MTPHAHTIVAVTAAALIPRFTIPAANPPTSGIHRRYDTISCTGDTISMDPTIMKMNPNKRRPHVFHAFARSALVIISSGVTLPCDTMATSRPDGDVHGRKLPFLPCFASTDTVCLPGTAVNRTRLSPTRGDDAWATSDPAYATPPRMRHPSGSGLTTATGISGSLASSAYWSSSSSSSSPSSSSSSIPLPRCLSAGQPTSPSPPLPAICRGSRGSHPSPPIDPLAPIGRSRTLCILSSSSTRVGDSTNPSPTPTSFAT
mmetsp:Transcript_8863/g.40269  ORF Transcript_8863/g.40269 Transcript_8863/m.40269 type:complete len:259 (+) Transcript_8863:918-1694(+)